MTLTQNQTYITITEDQQTEQDQQPISADDKREQDFQPFSKEHQPKPEFYNQSWMTLKENQIYHKPEPKLRPI